MRKYEDINVRARARMYRSWFLHAHTYVVGFIHMHIYKVCALSHRSKVQHFAEFRIFWFFSPKPFEKCQHLVTLMNIRQRAPKLARIVGRLFAEYRQICQLSTTNCLHFVCYHWFFSRSMFSQSLPGVHSLSFTCMLIFTHGFYRNPPLQACVSCTGSRKVGCSTRPASGRKPKRSRCGGSR